MAKKIIVLMVFTFSIAQFSSADSLKTEDASGNCLVLKGQQLIETIEMDKIPGTPEGQLLRVPPFHPKYFFWVLVHNHGSDPDGVNMVLRTKKPISKFYQARVPVSDFNKGEKIQIQIELSEELTLLCSAEKLIK